jgi:uncharacterized membrane protein
MSDTTEVGPSSSPSAGGPGGSGLPENVAGALAYLLGPITGIAFFIIDRPRQFVRFHAVQSIGLTVVWVVLAIALTIVSAILGFIPVLGWLVSILLNLGLAVAGFALWLWLMFQAYQGKTWEVPGLGPHVRRLVAETGGESPNVTS